MSVTLSSSVLEQLKAIVEPAQVLTDAQDLALYGRDWTKAYDPAPCAIVMPKTTEQVQAIVKLANAENIALVPSGGRTGLSAGAVAKDGELVVSFDKMNKMRDFNPTDRTVVCGAGVVTEQLQEYAKENGLFYPVDFASSGSSQIGGNISTNAGGINVIRYGMTRDWVAGLTVVTGAGEIIELNKGLLKNNAGYDLRQLFIGAEGTLGFICEATMQLTRPPQDLNVLVLGVPEFSAIMNVLEAFQAKMELNAFEFFSEKAMCKVIDHTGLPRPFETESPYYALLEYEAGTEAMMDEVMALFEHCVEQGWVLDGVISQSEAQKQNLWRLREDISETITPWTPYKNDISSVVSKVPEFLTEIESVVVSHYPDFEIIWFGHIGDGNLHLNILKPESLSREEFLDKCHHVSKWVCEIVQRYEGSISAEHGVGLLKRDFLHYGRSEAEIALMKSVKAAFDPNGIMNPGKIFQ